MRVWRYNEQDEGTKDVTEEEILATYWPYWRDQMRQIGKAHLISQEHCIDDFVTVHWAWLVKP